MQKRDNWNDISAIDTSLYLAVLLNKDTYKLSPISLTEPRP